MSLFFIVFPVMLLLVVAMSVGVLFGRRPIAGTCGGLNNMGADGGCELCGGDPALCDGAEGPYDAFSESEARVARSRVARPGAARTDLAHDATRG